VVKPVLLGKELQIIEKQRKNNLKDLEMFKSNSDEEVPPDDDRCIKKILNIKVDKDIQINKSEYSKMKYLKKKFKKKKRNPKILKNQALSDRNLKYKALVKSESVNQLPLKILKNPIFAQNRRKKPTGQFTGRMFKNPTNLPLFTNKSITSGVLGIQGNPRKRRNSVIDTMKSRKALHEKQSRRKLKNLTTQTSPVPHKEEVEPKIGNYCMILHPDDIKKISINPNTAMNMIDLENKKVYVIPNTMSYKFENIMINGQKRTNVMFK